MRKKTLLLTWDFWRAIPSVSEPGKASEESLYSWLFGLLFSGTFIFLGVYFPLLVSWTKCAFA